MNKNPLDQFYTNPIVAEKLVAKIFSMFPQLKNKEFIEPSAGTGNFINALINKGINGNKILGLDLEPKDNLNLNIKKENYLNFYIPFSESNITIGNPPFGKRGNLAVEFLNKSLNESSMVCFILPNIFNRYSVQKKIKSGAKLIWSEDVIQKAFLVNDSPYNVKCVFQIWVNEPFITLLNDFRILESPQIKHNEFSTFIHNNTIETLKYFDKEKYKWDMAIVRQGYYDYTIKITNESELKTNRQYIFVKFHNDISKQIFEMIDFVELSKMNTQIPGFSTSDLVKVYNEIKEKIIW